MENENILQKINNLEEQILKLKSDYQKHQHDGKDGTNILRKNIELDKSSFLKVGYLEQASAPIFLQGDEKEQMQHVFSLSKTNKIGAVNKLDALQVNFLHQPNNPSKQSFIIANRSPIITPFEGQTVSTTAGQTTITINNFNFKTNELAGGLISIYNSSNVYIETRVISSNTSNVITVSSAWGSSTSNGLFFIYTPVYLGSADNIFQRFYTQEGEGGGIRFGMGTTNGGQNGLLYMNSVGDLYWRNKGGTAINLGGGVSVGSETNVTISDGEITPTGQYVRVETEGGASTDNLDTINASSFPDGSIFILRAGSSIRTVVVTENGNLRLNGNFSLDHSRDTITLMKDGSIFYEISRSDNYS